VPSGLDWILATSEYEISPLCADVDNIRVFFCVTRICSSTRDRSECVAPAKNNFICASIVKRKKPTRDAVCSPNAGRPHTGACLLS
jgi:hypothetical protein